VYGCGARCKLGLLATLPAPLIAPRSAMRTSGGTLGLVASSSNGSPGASASTVNSTMLMPSRLGTAISRRRRM